MVEANTTTTTTTTTTETSQDGTNLMNRPEVLSAIAEAKAEALRARAGLTLAETERVKAEIAGQIAAQQTTYFQSYWRPAMGWLYMLLVAFDFIAAPVLMPYVWRWTGMTPYPWHPLTLEGGGLIHVAFGAVLGITSWTRGQEKTASVNALSSS